MSNRTIISWTVALAIVGAATAGLLAQRRQTAVVQSEKVLIASMVNPGNLLASPRDYNQTLAESVDQPALVTQLQQAGFPVTASQLDVLPDSFHIQATLSLSRTVAPDQSTQLGTAVTTALDKQTQKLAGEILDGQPTVDPKVALTKVLPLEVSYNQRPATAALFGALAGALLGLFIALALTDRQAA